VGWGNNGWTLDSAPKLLPVGAQWEGEERREEVCSVFFGGVREGDVRAKTPLIVGRRCSAGKGKVCEDMKVLWSIALLEER